jgi:transcriptional regulator with XRE-family HTH domain
MTREPTRQLEGTRPFASTPYRKAVHLTAAELAWLREQPYNTAGNRLDLALSITKTRTSEVAAAVGVGQPRLSNIKNGSGKRHLRIRVEVAEQIAAYFGCEVEDLFATTELTLRMPTREPATLKGAFAYKQRAAGRFAGRSVNGQSRKLPPPEWVQREYQALVEELVDRRVALRLALADVAEQSGGRSRQQVEQWESGSGINVDSLLQWAAALKMRVLLIPEEELE